MIVVAVMGIGLMSATPAKAVQASGSCALLPSDNTLVKDQEIDIIVRVNNTSSDTGGDGTADVAAILTGVTLETDACADSTCSTPLPGTLEFVSCTIINANVDSCVLDPADITGNRVKITMKAGGATIAAGGNIQLVSVKKKAVSPVTSPASGQFFARASTVVDAPATDDLRACSSVTPTSCATGGAEGSTTLFFPGVCGDGIFQPELGEACDDGNTSNADSCRNDCTIPVCGDEIVDAGEECDDGNTVDTDSCRNDCTAPRCGDAIVDAGEQCDDGNTNNSDSCRNDCTIPVCGDSIVDPGEECDDGNSVNTDSCRNDCTLPECGDGIKDANEQCDDGNTVDTDGCRNNCTLPECGDGILDSGEECDDGNTNNTDSCRNDCTIPVCGDGIQDAGEECDDGNNTNTDGCRNDCTLPYCGDGILDRGEQCDDGNTVSGDGCEADCTIIQLEGCRTTGGGKQYASENQVCPVNVRYVTHGGQVGASFGVASAPVITDCETGAGTGFNNPCIRGEYQHVRHFQGGLRGNFHAAGNGNEHNFDSLMCACLPCSNDPFGLNYSESYPAILSEDHGCHPADRLYVGDGQVEGLCNPGNRVCGPEPRRAPANKIAFSGLADYTLTKGKKTPQSVVFRVDIEDRSEPGGAHPKGGKAPADRYRMRMWFVGSGTAFTTDASIKRLREAVAVKDAHDERVGTAYAGFAAGSGKMCNGANVPAPDIDDGGDLDRGNRQIHPSTGASCH